MLEVKVGKESPFLKALEAMLDLVDVARVHCSDAGLKLQAMDTEEIAAIALHFPPEEFQKYYCNEAFHMGIPIDEMVKTIRCFDKSETIIIKVDDENIDTITLLPQENKTTAYDLRVVDSSSHRFDIPDLKVFEPKYQAIVQMPSVEFTHVCKYLSSIGGDGHISVNEKGLKFFAEGKSGRVNIKYMQPATVVTYDMRAPVSFTLDLKYMNTIAKASSLFDQVKIYLSTTLFLIVECKIRQMNIKYFLEPKGRAEENKGSAEEDKGGAEINGSGEVTAATMLELKLEKEKVNLFLNALEAMLDLVDVASVSCSITGLKLQAKNSEHITIIELFFPAEVFQHYRYNEGLSMSIPIDDMVKAIRCADKDDTITIKVGDENFDTITLSFESPQENNTRAYDLRVVDARSHCFRTLHLQNYEANVQMPSAEFMRVCKCLSNVGSDGHISVNEKGLKFFAKGKSGRININYRQPEKATAVPPEKATATVVTYSMQAPVSMTLDLKYMYSIAKASTRFDQVKIGLSTTQFLMVECKIGRMGYIRYFLAPKVKKIINLEEEEEIKKREKWNRDDKDKGSVKGIKKKAKIEKGETETDD